MELLYNKFIRLQLVHVQSKIIVFLTWPKLTTQASSCRPCHHSLTDIITQRDRETSSSSYGGALVPREKYLIIYVDINYVDINYVDINVLKIDFFFLS